MAQGDKTFNLTLTCDLEQASNYYGVEIEEIEMKEYHTNFSVTDEDSNATLAIQCNGCNEQISVHIIELPRINNFKSSKFLFQIAIVLILVLLPSVPVNINPVALYLLMAFGILTFLSEIYDYVFKPPARLDTLFFWHRIENAEK